MKKLLIILSLIVLCSLCIFGCGKKKSSDDGKSGSVQAAAPKVTVDPALVGTWDDSLLPAEQQLGYVWTFKSDGTGVGGILLDEPYTYSAENGKMHLVYTGGFGEYDYVYSIEGDILNLTEVTEETQITYQYKKQ